MATFLIGMAGAVFALVIFFAGVFIGAKFLQPMLVKERVPTEAEIAAAEEERQLRLEEQKAFNQLLNYNADIAYGVRRMESD